MKLILKLRTFFSSLLIISVAACGGGGSSSNNNSSSTAPIAQSFNFSQTGTIKLVTGDTLANPATGQGSGLVTYTSSDSNVVNVDTNGLLTVRASGTATISASKAADSNYLAATTSATVITVPKSLEINAWIGSNDTLVSFPAAAKGIEFYRSSADTCDWSRISTCANGHMDILSDSIFTDTVATNTQTGFYVFKHGNKQASIPLTGHDIFAAAGSRRTVSFNNQLWVINCDTKMEAWLLGEGNKWELKSADTGIPARTEFQLTQFNNKLWITGGTTQYTTNTDQDTNFNDVWSSSDGIHWTQEVANAPFSPRAHPAFTAFNNKLWVINGNEMGAHISQHSPFYDAWSSIDGINWVKESSDIQIEKSFFFGPDDLHNAITYNNKLWLTGTTSSDVWSSTNGVDWVLETRFVGNYENLNSYTPYVFNNKLWVPIGPNWFAEGYPTELWSSTDGKTWTQEQNSLANRSKSYFTVTAHKNALWLIDRMTNANNQPSNEVWTSTNGNDWNQIYTFKPKFALATTFNNSLWLIGGLDAYDASDIWSSADGLNWEKKAHIADETMFFYKPTAITFNNQMMIISLRQGIALTSTDGINWSKQPLQGSPLNWDYSVVSFKNKLWVVGGEGRRYLPPHTMIDGPTNDVWSSTDGITWVQETANANFPARYNHQVFVFNNALWIIGGQGNGDPALMSDVWSSTDGISWTQQTDKAAFGGRVNHSAFAFNNKIWVMNGQSAKSNLIVEHNDVWSSADGINWTQEVAQTPYLARASSKVVELNNRIFMIGGDSLKHGALDDIWSSTNGTEWRQGVKATVDLN